MAGAERPNSGRSRNKGTDFLDGSRVMDAIGPKRVVVRPVVLAHIADPRAPGSLARATASTFSKAKGRLEGATI